MVAARSRSAASGGKNSVHTNGDVGFSPKCGETRKVATDTGLGCGVPYVLLLLLLLLYSATILRRQAGA
uniref:Uncharacterized protein n=1 Tax=Anopheles coluzzii TaxID=1518534 RepID=A0A8W7PT89_ANOCL